MRPIKLLFDATIFSGKLDVNAGRAGIYFTALNIFKKFSEDSRFSIRLYFQNEIDRLNNDYLKNFPKVCNYIDI